MPGPDTATRQEHPPQPARSHFTMIPDLVGDLDLDPYAFRLYCHLRRVAGEQPNEAGRSGACWQSTATLAAACRISTGKVSQSKRRLVEAGLIRIEKRPGPGGLHDHITLVDIWSANRRHFASTPAPSAGERSNGERVHSAGVPVHAVNASPSDDERSPECVHSKGVAVRVVNALPSPGETNQIPYNQISSSRKDEDDDDEDDLEKPDRRNPPDADAEVVMDAEAVTDAVVGALYLQELGHPPTPLQREEIAELVAHCDDRQVWRRAFLRSAGARHRWAYIAQCIRNAAESPQPCRPTRPKTAPPSAAPPQTAAEAKQPEAEHVKRWTEVLEVLSWRLPAHIFRDGFAPSTCIGERDSGKTWEVVVPRPAFLAWLQQPGHTVFVDKALRQCGFGDVAVNFIAPPA